MTPDFERTFYRGILCLRPLSQNLMCARPGFSTTLSSRHRITIMIRCGRALEPDKSTSRGREYPLPQSFVQEERGSAVAKAMADEMPTGMMDKEASRNTRFCETNPNRLDTKTGSKHCAEDGYEHYRKITNGFVFPRYDTIKGPPRRGRGLQRRKQACHHIIHGRAMAIP